MSEGNKKPYDFTFEGKVVDLPPTETFSSGFKKRKLVLDNAPEGKDWKNPVPFIFKKEEIGKLDNIKVGMVVKVSGWFEGRKWDGPKGTQYFCDNTVFGKVEVVKGAAIAQAAATVESDDTSAGDDDGSDMPF